MRPGRTSWTAEINAAFRASETMKAEHIRLFDDPLAVRFLSSRLRLLVATLSWPVIGKALTALVDLRWPGVRSAVVARTRLIDDWIRQAAAEQGDGGQLVILGAGFDTRSWRLRELSHWRVFEVDHPDTSRAKQSRLAGVGIDLASNKERVTFAAVDFDRQSFSAVLADAGFDPRSPSIVLWDGVSNYLTADAVDAVVRWVGSTAANTTFIFTYIDAAVLDLDASQPGAKEVKASIVQSGEPWTFGFNPEDVQRYLKARNLRLMADLDADQFRMAVMGPEAGRINGYAFYHAVRAEVIRS